MQGFKSAQFRALASRAKPQQFANGGPVRGPGTGISDEVQDEVPQGTYIMPADSTQAVGEDQLADMGKRGFRPVRRGAVPVALSNGEYKLPPEQVHAIGAQVLDQVKAATHAPARGFRPSMRKAAMSQGAQPGQEPEPEPRMFFADGGEVDPGAVTRVGNSYSGGIVSGNIRVNGAAPGGTFSVVPGQATAPARGFQPSRSAPAGRSVFGGPQQPAQDSARVGQLAQPGSAQSEQAGAQATPSAAPMGWAERNAQRSLEVSAGVMTPGLERDAARRALAAKPAAPTGLPGLGVVGQNDAAPATGGQVQPPQDGSARGFQPRQYADGGLVSERDDAAAEALAARSAAAGGVRGFSPPGQVSQAAPQFSAPQVQHSGNSWEARNNLRNLEVSASSITNTPERKANLNKAYLAGLNADLEARGLQPKMDSETNQVNAAMAREGLQQAGAMDRTALEQASETGRTRMQQAFADVRERRAAAQQTEQNDMARRRLDIDEMKAAQAGVPAGYRFGSDGRTLEAIAGGPADPTRSKEAMQQGRDAQDVLSILDQARPLVNIATGSYAGNAVDKAAQVFGMSTPGADAGAQLKALQGALVSKMPKMSGPQSDKDVLLYREMAGQIGDPTIPARQRLAAMNTVEALHRKYAPDGTQQGQGGTSPSGQAAQSQQPQQRAITRTGTLNGRKVVQYADGSISYAD